MRPLTDQARGALFNILAAKVPGARFLDVFAGTGAVGIEALSRGAQLAIFVEMNRQVVALIRENLEWTDFTDRAEVYAIEATRAMTALGTKQAKFDIIFLGAPYDSPALEKTIERIVEHGLLEAGGVLVAEHRRQHPLAEKYGPLGLIREARYGETVLAFYKAEK